jgi:two-component system chemotaxis response regulator CheY
MLKKVLIVEDSSLQAKMYRTVFSGYKGCELVFALNGLEAMDKLALENDIDLIILDINMPKMNGLSFLESLKNNRQTDVPVLVISTEGKDEDIRRALDLGAKAYIKKPWRPDQVKEMVEKIVPAQ